MKKILLLFATTCLITMLQAQVSKTVTVGIAGGLSNMLTSAEMTTVTDLTISGSLNALDFGTIRSISSLQVLRISNVTIQSYTYKNGTYSKTFPAKELPSLGNLSNLKTIYLPYSLLAIGDYAFLNCSSLTSITIPTSVTSIGQYAFYGCSSIPSISIPSNVTSINAYTFGKCLKLASVTIPSSVTSIGDHAFWACPSLTTLSIPSLVSSIGIAAFSLSGLKSMDINSLSLVTVISDSLFCNCSNLTSVVIPSSTTSIGKYVFSECQNLTDINIPTTVLNIGDGAFFDCGKLTNITLPPNLTYISKYTFQGCGITTIVIPSKVTTIGDQSFTSSSITSISIPPSVIFIGASAFHGCINLTTITIPSSVTSINDYVFYGCTGLSSITIPASVKSIGNFAFYGCTGLTTITIPSSVNSIGNSTFYGCTGLISIIAKATTPVDLSNKTQVFNLVDKNKCTLYVPVGSYSDYRTANQWKDFYYTTMLPEITWSTPIEITYGTPLDSNQLNAIANTNGNFVYTPSADTILTVGTHKLLTRFTASSIYGNYSIVFDSVYIKVNKAMPQIIWNVPSKITYGAILDTTQLYATANVNGTFTYSPAVNSVINVGTHTIITTFTPIDTVNYKTINDTLYFKATPVISLSTPQNITYGTAIDTTIIKGTANIQGVFTFMPPLNTILNAGSQTVIITFTPSNTTDYSIVSDTVIINVNKTSVQPTISWNTPATITYGTALSKAQLNATANVAGIFVYSPTLNTVLQTGTDTLITTFTPTNATNYINPIVSDTVLIMVKPSTPIITSVGNTIHSSAVTGNQWYNQNGIIVGATSQDFTPTTNGDYYLIVTINGVSSEPSNTIKVTVTGVSITNNTSVKISPNPVKDELKITLYDNSEKIIFSIITATGQVIYTGDLVKEKTISTAQFTNGVYYIRFANGEVKSFVKE